MNYHRSKKPRRGALAVEFALVLPFLVMLFVAAIEFSRANTLRNSVENASYEGARRGIVPGATVASVEATVHAALEPIGVRGTQVVVSPDPIPTDADEITVTVTLPIDQNAYTVPRFFKGYRFDASCAMRTERSLAVD